MSGVISCTQKKYSKALFTVVGRERERERERDGYNSNLESVSGMRVSGVGGGVWSERGSGVGGGGGGGTARVSQGGERVQSHPLILVHLLCQLQHTHRQMEII